MKKPKKIRCVWVDNTHFCVEIMALEDKKIITVIDWVKKDGTAGSFVAPYGTPKREMERYAKRYFN